jgi:hypothetical protein
MQYRIFFQIILLSFLLIVKSAISQSVRLKDKWGDEVVFVDGALIKRKINGENPFFLGMDPQSKSKISGVNRVIILMGLP